MAAIALFSRAVGPIGVSAVLREKITTEIGITENPIETGAAVTDHAYIMPKKVTLEIADKNAAATFNALMRFQESRVPFTLVTGWTVLKNMLIKSVNADRDAASSRVLRATVECQEAIIVSTAYAAGEGGDDRPSSGDSRTSSNRPTPETAGDPATADQVSGTVQRGDSPTQSVPPGESQSILNAVFA